jgi:hypothetical protein
VKDNISLIAAATGGFMLSLALCGLLRGTPMTAWNKLGSSDSVMVTSSPIASLENSKTGIFLPDNTQKS